MTRLIVITVLAAFLGAAALPVHGYFQVQGFYNASNKYREWFQETRLLPDARPRKSRQEIRLVSAATSVRYPYPDKAFVMTERRWLKSAKESLQGNPDWYDVEVVRQRAEVEEYAPAMDLLGWMYQEGRGLKKDMRKAYTMYERAKLAGKPKVRGNTAKIFDRLNPLQQLVAKIQLLEDTKRIKPDAAPVKKGSDQVRLRVFKQQRDPKFVRFKRQQAKKRSQSLLGLGN